MDIRSYWREIRRVQATLPECSWLTSLDNWTKNTTSGAVVLCDPENAARRLVEQTHRPSTEQEIEQHLRGEEEKLRRISADERRRLKSYVLVVQPQEKPHATQK